MRTAMISRNKVMAAYTPVTVVSRSSVMSVIITFMFEPAKLQMNWASASGARNLRRSGTDRDTVALEAMRAACAIRSRIGKGAGLPAGGFHPDRVITEPAFRRVLDG